MAPVDDTRFTPRSREDVLEHVYRRGRRLRLRELALRGMALTTALALVVAVGAGLRDGGTDADRVTAAGEGRDARTEEGAAAWGGPRPGERTEPSGAEPSALSPPAGVTTAPIVGTPATEACRNSYDPACGPFFWDPPPQPNQRMTATLVDVVDDTGASMLVDGEVHAAPGQPLTFRLHAEDPDARPGYECGTWHGFGDGPMGADCAVDCAAKTGAWTPPAPSPGTIDPDYSHRYEDRGDFTAEFHYRSGGVCEHPYADDAEVKVVVHIV